MEKFSLTLMTSRFPPCYEADLSFVQGIFNKKAFTNARNMTLPELRGIVICFFSSFMKNMSVKTGSNNEITFCYND